MSVIEDSIKEAEGMLRNGRLAEAKELLRSAAADNPDAAYLLAKIAVRERRFEDGRSLLLRVLTMDPGRSICHFDLGGIELEQGNFQRALPHLEEASVLMPDNPYVLLHKALVLEKLNRPYAAAVDYERCWAIALRRGELVKQLPPQLQALMAHGRRLIRNDLEQRLKAVLEEVHTQFKGGDLSRVERLVAVILGQAPPEVMPPLQKPGGLFFPGLPERKFFERELFPWMEVVESKTDAIRDEYLAFANEKEMFNPYVNVDERETDAGHWRGVNKSLAWSSCHIYRNGKLRENVAKRCPITVETLNKAPLNRVVDHGPEAMFSVLRPDTHIPPHHGTVNGRVIVHLPLIVPENCGALRVAGEARTWEYGRCLAFDDTYAHEAWNSSKETRVVLLFDVWSPFLSEIEAAAFARVIEAVDRINIDALGKAFLKE